VKLHRGWIVGMAILLVPLGVISVAKGEGAQVGWTVVDNRPALARNGSIIRIGGTGAFVPDDPEGVTGGGTWLTLDATGAHTGSGTFQATRLVKFDPAPGSIPGTNFEAGLAFLLITYNDGAHGILIVSCNLGPTSPPSVSEGFSASKGDTIYWDGFKGNAFFSVPPQS
jgi:hypothetical protein